MQNSLLEKYKRCSFYRQDGVIFPEYFDKNECYNFIKKYFEYSHKENLLDVDFINEYLVEGKHQHIVNLFYMGILLRDIIKDYFKEMAHFDFIWFLACLYHDTASVIEENGAVKGLDLDFYLGKYNILYNVFDYTWEEKKPYRYSEALIKNYFKYRLSKNYIDHGILSGYLLYDKLRKNYDNKYSEPHEGNYNDFRTSNGKYHWEIEHHKYYAIAAHTVIEHNIWLAQENDDKTKRKYKEFGLNELVQSKNKDLRISIENSPLLFYFGLLDSIEPLKHFSYNNAKSILDKISFECSNCEIVVKYNKELISNKEYDNWINSIYDMKKWLYLDIYPLNKEDINQEIQIQINRSFMHES